MHDDSLGRHRHRAHASATRPGEIAVTLRDGSRVTVRPIRPEDAEALRAGFERLSDESRYRRFLSPMSHLSEPMLRYLTEVDHHDHEALVAVGDDGTLLGVARSVRSRSDPRVAEAAVTVADDWQGRGMGTALLGILADRARAEGIHHFTALMLATNREMFELFEDLGPVRILEQASGTVELDITLAPPWHRATPRRAAARLCKRPLRGDCANPPGRGLIDRAGAEVALCLRRHGRHDPGCEIHQSA